MQAIWNGKQNQSLPLNDTSNAPVETSWPSIALDTKNNIIQAYIWNKKCVQVKTYENELNKTPANSIHSLAYLFNFQKYVIIIDKIFNSYCTLFSMAQAYIPGVCMLR